MIAPEIPNELDRWMTPERIAHSDLMRLLHEGYLEKAWDETLMMDLAMALIRGFGNACCFYLASVLAHDTGFPIACFWRASDPDAPVLHAVVVDPQTNLGYDILGCRAVATIRHELTEAVGPIRLSIEPAFVLGDELEGEEVAILSEIAAGMPWMPGAMKPSASKAEWAQLVISYVEARLLAAGREP
jgi:hypothetical protein